MGGDDLGAGVARRRKLGTRRLRHARRGRQSSRGARRQGGLDHGSRVPAPRDGASDTQTTSRAQSSLGLGLGAAARRDDGAGDLLDARRVLAPSRRGNRTTEPSTAASRRSASPRVPGLAGPRARPPARERRSTPAPGSARARSVPPARARHGNGVFRVQATQLYAARQNEHVRREAVAALVRREPEIVLGDVSGERAVHRSPTQSAASVAAPVAADENERSWLGSPAVSRSSVGEIVVAPELDPRTSVAVSSARTTNATGFRPYRPGRRMKSTRDRAFAPASRRRLRGPARAERRWSLRHVPTLPGPR